MYGPYVPSMLTGHHGGLPRVQDHPGLRISYLAGIGLVDFAKGRESLGSLVAVSVRGASSHHR